MKRKIACVPDRNIISLLRNNLYRPTQADRNEILAGLTASRFENANESRFSGHLPKDIHSHFSDGPITFNLLSSRQVLISKGDEHKAVDIGFHLAKCIPSSSGFLCVGTIPDWAPNVHTVDQTALLFTQNFSEFKTIETFAAPIQKLTPIDPYSQLILTATAIYKLNSTQSTHSITELPDHPHSIAEVFKTENDLVYLSAPQRPSADKVITIPRTPIDYGFQVSRAGSVSCLYRESVKEIDAPTSPRQLIWIDSMVRNITDIGDGDISISINQSEVRIWRSDGSLTIPNNAPEFRTVVTTQRLGSGETLYYESGASVIHILNGKKTDFTSVALSHDGQEVTLPPNIRTNGNFVLFSPLLGNTTYLFNAHQRTIATTLSGRLVSAAFHPETHLLGLVTQLPNKYDSTQLQLFDLKSNKIQSQRPIEGVVYGALDPQFESSLVVSVETWGQQRTNDIDGNRVITDHRRFEQPHLGLCSTGG
jgi:hypothetical protein